MKLKNDIDFLKFQKKRYGWLLVICLFSFLISLSIYLLLRSSNLKFINFAENKIPLLFEARKKSLSYSHSLPDFLLYNVPDALFLLAYNTLIIWIWYPKKNSVYWIVIMLILMFLLEGLQYLGVLSGTFDVSDIYAYLFSTGFSYVLFKFVFKKIS